MNQLTVKLGFKCILLNPPDLVTFSSLSYSGNGFFEESFGVKFPLALSLYLHGCHRSNCV